MRRRGPLALVATVAVGLLVLALVGIEDKRDLAFTIGVVPTIPAATLHPGQTVCQEPISVSESFERVRVRAGSPGGPGEPVDVSVRLPGSSQVIARGRLPGGYPYGSTVSARVDPVRADQRIAVCLRDAGDRRVSVFGNAANAAPPSEAHLGDRVLENDVALVFLKEGRRSMLSEVPDVFARASVFRPGWVGTWTFWVLAGLVLLGVPALLARALSDADEPTRAP
jgi:hypothetical protein